MYQKKYFMLATTFLFAFIFCIFSIYTPLMADGKDIGGVSGMDHDELVLISTYGGIIGNTDKNDDNEMDHDDDILKENSDLTYYGQKSYWGSAYPYTKATTSPWYRTGVSTTTWPSYAASSPTHTYSYSPGTYSTGLTDYVYPGYNTPVSSARFYATALETTTPLRSWTGPTVTDVDYGTSDYYSEWPTNTYVTTPSTYSSLYSKTRDYFSDYLESYGLWAVAAVIATPIPLSIGDKDSNP